MRGLRIHVPTAAAVLALALGGCGESTDPAGSTPRQAPSTADPITLTDEERAVWTTPAPHRDRVPVLLYHGIGPAAGFADAADAAYGIERSDFARQLALLAHAGYEAITLDQFRRFHAGEPVELPAHPILLTFDDGRADSWQGADGALRDHGWSAVLFADAGRIDRGDREYVSWSELARMQESGRWEIQLHAGRGHHNIRYGPRPRDVGPFYAFRDMPGGEKHDGWRRRVLADLDWGEAQLRRHVPGYAPRAFAPPYGNYGQISTNDPAIPRVLGRELRRRYGVVFTQADPRPARPGDVDVPRLQITRRMTGGELHAWLSTPPMR
jgi:peptidoglycan/xylan/chitin deacetylase (PgdA/CDA1 family)